MLTLAFTFKSNIIPNVLHIMNQMNDQQFQILLNLLQEHKTDSRNQMQAFKADISNQLQEFKIDIDKKFEQVDKRFEQMDKKFEQIDKRFEQMDNRFEQMDNRFEQMDKRFEQIDKRFEQTEHRQERLEDRQESDREMLQKIYHSRDKVVAQVTWNFLWKATAFNAVLLTLMISILGSKL